MSTIPNMDRMILRMNRVMVSDALLNYTNEDHVIAVQKYLNTQLIAVKKNLKQFSGFTTVLQFQIEYFPNQTSMS